MATASSAGRAHIGCSGWNYKDWRGLVYPEKLPVRLWFEHYQSVLGFDTVEINNTFYRLPPPTTVEKWEAQAPDGFTYALKLGQFGSHRMKLKDSASWLPNHFDRIERLGANLGPTLVQLPPRWKRNADRLDEFLTVATELSAASPAADHLRWAVEMRDESWLHDEVYEVLQRHGAALCLHDLLADHPQILTTDWTYVRFHGPDALVTKYRGEYTGNRLWRTADRMAGWLDAGHDVYAYFNNDYEGHAVRDATWLRDRLVEYRAPAPTPQGDPDSVPGTADR